MAPQLTSSERSMHGRIAAHQRWAHEPDRYGATAAARGALAKRFAAEIDPDGSLERDNPAEFERRFAHAKKAFYVGLALKSALSRRQKAGR